MAHPPLPPPLCRRPSSLVALAASLLLVACGVEPGGLLGSRGVDADGGTPAQRAVAATAPIFADRFERADVFTKPWRILANSNGSKASFSTRAPLPGRLNVRRGATSGLISLTRSFEPPLRNVVVSVRYLARADDGMAVSVANRALSRYTILQSRPGGYAYRTQRSSRDVGRGRAAGWHQLELVVTDSGSYARVDGMSLTHESFGVANYFAGINFEQRELAHLSLGMTRGAAVTFDDVVVRPLDALPSLATRAGQQAALDHWAARAAAAYRDADVSGVVNALSTGGPGHAHTMYARGLVNHAALLLREHRRGAGASYRQRALLLLHAVLNNHHRWGQVSLSNVAAFQLALTAWTNWDLVDTTVKVLTQRVLAREASFWSWVLHEVRERPGGSTVPNIAKHSDPRAIDYERNSSIVANVAWRDDSKAEESAACAFLLAIARAMMPDAPGAAAWDRAARTWARLTVTAGARHDGVYGRTVAAGSLALGNHGFNPNPLYALGTIHTLQQGELVYLAAGRAAPAALRHNLVGDVASTFFQTNLAKQGLRPETRFQITDAAINGRDWGDKNYQIAAQMLAHFDMRWGSAAAARLLRQLLAFSYHTMYQRMRVQRRGRIARVTPSNGEMVPWILNLATHVQAAERFALLRHLDDAAWRARRAPQNLRAWAAGALFARRKVWRGSLTALADRVLRREGRVSLVLRSGEPSDAELYSDLIPVRPSRRYTLRYWVKTADLRRHDAAVYGRVLVAEYRDGVGWDSAVNAARLRFGDHVGENHGGTRDWHLVRRTFTTSSRTRFVRLRAALGLRGRASGTVYFDGVRLLPQ